MTRHSRRRILPWALGLWLLVPLAYAQTPAAPGGRADANAAIDANAGIIQPGPHDGRIAALTGLLLQMQHYSHKPLDTNVSSLFLDHYIRDYDPQHIHFLQSDIDRLQAYRYRLNESLTNQDSKPAYLIFAVFLRRLEERTDYSVDLLKKESFDFSTTDRVTLNRKGLPFPKDIEQAHQLWRDRVRADYLGEKLNEPNPDLVAKLLLEKLKQEKPDQILASIRASTAAKEAAKLNHAAQTNDTPETAEPKIQNDITLALNGKVGDDRADAIAAMVAERLPREKPEEIANAVRTKVEAEDKSHIIDVLTRRYNRVVKTFKEWDNDNVLEVYLNALAHVYDPHSDYLGKSALENFSIGMNLSLFGIGAQLQADDGYCKIIQLLPGPALKSKRLKVGDRIVAVAQGDDTPVDIVEMPLTKAVNLIRGPKDTQVRLTVIPAEAPDQTTRKIVSLVRDEIKLQDQQAKAKIIEFPSTNSSAFRLGIIQLPSFYSTMDLGVSRGQSTRVSTTDDVAKLLRRLEKENVKGVILDLRGNGGGSLTEAVELTSLFIKPGPVVQVRNSAGDVSVEEDKDASLVYDGPLVVLTSRFSASATEIVAGALQDYGRALLVGESSTHGKGTVQSLISLKQLVPPIDEHDTSDPGAVKLTIKKFYRPSGQSTQLKGVTPDIVLPSVNNVADVGEAALENALGAEPIDPAKFEHLDVVQPYLADLKRRSAERVNSSKDFEYIREDMALYTKMQLEKSVSLNERERLKEKDDAMARQKVRDRERVARKQPDAKVYDLTLALADSPEPLQPVVITNAVASAKMTAPAVDPETGMDSEGSADDTKAPPMDPVLDETEHILRDYLGLLPKGAVVSANQGGGSH